MSGNYFERKQARKEQRTQQFQNRYQRSLDLKDRRAQAPKGIIKEEFQSWFQAKLAREEKWDRQARQQGKDWKIQVAVILERLPQVLPDKEDFEKDFEELQAYLAQFGKQYPKEFSSTMAGNGAAPISDEELIGTFSSSSSSSSSSSFLLRLLFLEQDAILYWLHVTRMQ